MQFKTQFSPCIYDSKCAYRDGVSSRHPHCPTPDPSNGGKSAWSQNLRSLLGDVPEVETFDRLRRKIKEKNVNKDTKEMYQKSIATLQTKVSKHHTTLKLKMEEWERDFMYQNNRRCPTLADVDNAPDNIKEVLRGLKVARGLMRAFGMKGFK